jgi:hypothetical protein
MGKVTQTHFEVFHEHTHFMNGLQVGADLLQARYIEWTDSAPATILCLSAGFPNILFGSGKDGLRLSDRSQSGIQLRDQMIGLR